ncbi:MAG: hypothetical protein AAF333_03155 [Planctomycetota bacterium]
MIDLTYHFTVAESIHYAARILTEHFGWELVLRDGDYTGERYTSDLPGGGRVSVWPNADPEGYLSFTDLDPDAVLVRVCGPQHVDTIKQSIAEAAVDLLPLRDGDT